MSGDEVDHVVIFKSVSESDSEEKDAYSEAFLSAGFEVTLIPVLDFDYVNLKEILEKLKNPSHYAGIIFSSPRCVHGVRLSAAEDSSVLEEWKKHRFFAVGEKTAVLAEDLGFKVEGREAGNGDKLAEIITKEQYSKPFLYPIGSLTRKNLELRLKEKNIEVDGVEVYCTKPHPDMEEHISKLKSHTSSKKLFFIYFSPSGVNFSLPILKKLNFDLDLVKMVAIGPTTEAGLLESGLQVSATAAKPNPSSVLKAVLSVKAKKRKSIHTVQSSQES